MLFANLGIAAINIYFLYEIYSTRGEFKIINAITDSEYYRHFLDVKSKEISKQIGMDDLKKDHTALYMLRDNDIAGVLTGEQDSEDESESGGHEDRIGEAKEGAELRQRKSLWGSCSVTRAFDYSRVFIHRVFPAIMSLPYRYHSS